MSHIAEYKCALEGVDLDLLKMAIKVVADQLEGGRVSKTVDSYSYSKNLKKWGEKEIFASIRSKNLPQGVGLHIDKKGKIHYLVNVAYLAETRDYSDSRKSADLKKQCKEEFEKIQNQLIIAYQSAAMVQVLTELGYEITESATAEDGSQFMRAVEA